MAAKAVMASSPAHENSIATLTDQNTDAIARAICRPNIELLLDAVESTEKAEAERASSNEMTEPHLTAADNSGNQPSSLHHRRNIDMLLDAVESTKMAADAESRVHRSSTRLVTSAVDADTMDSDLLVIKQELLVSGRATPTAVSKNGYSSADLMSINGNDNVVVEKIVSYLGDYSPVKPTFDVMEVVVATTPLEPEKKSKTNGKRRKTVQNKTKPKRRRVRKVKKVKIAPSLPLPPPRAAPSSTTPKTANKPELDDDRTCDMVVPVDPQFMGSSCRSTSSVIDGGSSEDDGKDLLEVEVPCPFRSVGTREVAHSAEAIDFALTHNLIKKFKPCAKCGTEVALNMTNLTFRCSRLLKSQMNQEGKKKRCQFKQSARVGTWFEKACMSLQGVLHVTFLWLAMKRPRTAFVIKQLHCSPQTLVDWASYCREVCVFYVESQSQVLGGSGRTVEMYEPKIVNRRRRGTQIMDGTWIFGGFERESGKLFVVPVPERSKESLLLAVKQWVKPDTTIVSDCWRSCKCVGDAAYKRESDSNGYNFVGHEKTEWDELEKVWREVKCIIPRTGPCDLQLLGYLSEFLFKRKFGDPESRTLNFFQTVSKMYPGK